MAGTNSKLRKAKEDKDDEFYTLYDDVKLELENYKTQLEGKIIYCPCDDYRESNFVKYLKDNFANLGLKKLISTNYDLGDGAWKYEYDGANEVIEKLQGNGNYRSSESSALRDSSDIIITNPPFSLWRDFYAWLKEKDKKFLILGHAVSIGNAFLVSDAFNKKIWTGYTKLNNSMPFLYGPKKEIKTVNCSWYTNLDVSRGPSLEFTKDYYADPSHYERYDDYDAINVDSLRDIPYNYYGNMGVPVGILCFWPFDSDKFELLDAQKYKTNRVKPLPSQYNPSLHHAHISGKKKFMRIMIKLKK
jgi:hypothetical protein